MDQTDKAKLQAEGLALQAISVGILARLGRLDPEIRKAIERGFDDAADYVEECVLNLGAPTPRDHALQALQTVERLRARVMGLCT